MILFTLMVYVPAGAFAGIFTVKVPSVSVVTSSPLYQATFPFDALKEYPAPSGSSGLETVKLLSQEI